MLKESLTTREIEMLVCLSNGLSYKAIAGMHGITLDTVRKHLQSAYRKLEVQNNVEAVAKALREGIIK